MIHALNGKIVSSDAKSIVVNVQGVEFFCEVSSQSAAYFAAHMNDSSVRVLTVMAVREDAMNLFGFKDESERECFLQLQTVPGVGAKQALKILSAITVADLVVALDRRDVSRLSRIPGVGAKSAQKLILQLRDVLVYTDDSPSGVENVKSENKKWNELIDSLVEMGFDKKKVISALDEVLKSERNNLTDKTFDESERYIFNILFRRLSGGR